MRTNRLVEKNLSYDPDKLNDWLRRDYSVFDKRIPNHVKDFLIKKAENRKKDSQKKRLFSEIMALNYYIDYVEDNVIWYSSFKWLSASKWFLGGMNDEVELKFYKDINQHFKFGESGEKDVEFIQQKAIDFKSKDKGKLLGFTKSGKVKNPTAPDIWLKHKNYGLILVEAKREEGLQPSQIAGIALIKKYFDLNTYIVRFYPNTLSHKPLSIDYTENYINFFNSV